MRRILAILAAVFISLSQGAGALAEVTGNSRDALEAEYEGNWLVVPSAAGTVFATQEPGAAVSVRFAGTELTLTARAAFADAEIRVSVDGVPLSPIRIPTGEEAAYTLITGLVDTTHRALLKFEGDGQLAVLGFAVGTKVEQVMPGAGLQATVLESGAVELTLPDQGAPFHIVRFFREEGAPFGERVLAWAAQGTYVDDAPPVGRPVYYAIAPSFGPRSFPVVAGPVTVAGRPGSVRIAAVEGVVFVERQRPGAWEGSYLLGIFASTDMPGGGLPAIETLVATPGFVLLPGDTVVTSAGVAEVTIDSQDQVLRLDVGTRAGFEQHVLSRNGEQQYTRFRAIVGRIWVNLLQKLGRSSRFEIETPTMVAGVQGTSFGVEVAGEDGESEVLLFTGEIEVVAANRKGDPVRPGARTKLTPGLGLRSDSASALKKPEEFVYKNLSQFMKLNAKTVKERLPDKLKKAVEEEEREKGNQRKEQSDGDRKTGGRGLDLEELLGEGLKDEEKRNEQKRTEQKRTEQKRTEQKRNEEKEKDKGNSHKSGGHK